MSEPNPASSRDSVLYAEPRTKALLARLHAKNTKQEASFRRKWFGIKFVLYCLRNKQSRDLWNSYCDLHCGDQLLSHSREKCEMIYMLACLNGSKSLIECGTSFGVSTIYMALAAQRNALNARENAFGVLTLEKDSKKIAEAKKIWTEAGNDVQGWIQSCEGDLLELLAQEKLLPPVVDLLFLDAWTSLALPALKLVLPRLRYGSLVFADKTTTAKFMYADLLEFVHDPANGFMSMTIPFTQGFEVMVYQQIRSTLSQSNSCASD